MNGDIIINHDSKKFGLIEKDSRRIYIVDNRKEKVDLYNWVYIYNDFQESKVEVYRSDIRVNLSKMDYEEVVNLTQQKEVELVTENKAFIQQNL